jgi:hypothetical protein
LGPPGAAGGAAAGAGDLVEPLAGEYGWAGDKSLDAFLRRGLTQLHTSHPTVMTLLSLLQRYSPRLLSSAIGITSPRWLIPTQGPKSCGQKAVDKVQKHKWCAAARAPN